MFDINNAGYGETITINDATTGTVLDTRSASSFANGEYLVWNISGSVTFTLTGTTNGGHWAVLNGVFFGPGAGTKAAAAPSGLTATTGQDQISLSLGGIDRRDLLRHLSQLDHRDGERYSDRDGCHRHQLRRHPAPGGRRQLL